jgi:nucleoside-diphosphate-sugar epimerase
MARALIVGCGCHGRELGGRLRERGWLVRGTSRSEDGAAAIEAVGFEAAVADPDRPGSVLELCADVGVVVWLLGSAVGEHDPLGAIHGPRLERLLERLVDSPVRGFVYEAAGTVPGELLDGGREIVERAARTWRIPVAIIEAERTRAGWADLAAERVGGSLAG